MSPYYLVNNNKNIRKDVLWKLCIGPVSLRLNLYHISSVIRQLFSFQNNPRPFGLFRKGKTYILAKFHRTYLVISNHSTEEKTRLIVE